MSENPFVRKSAGEFDNYFKLDAKKGVIYMSVKSGDNWTQEELGNLIEGDLRAINIGSYTYEGETHPTIELELWRLGADGKSASKAKFTTSASTGLSILNTLASQENLDGLTLGLNFYMKEYINSKGATKKGCQCAVEVNGKRWTKENNNGIVWKFSADQLKPIFSAEGQEKVDKLKSFVEKHIKPLFEKGPSKGSADYSKVTRLAEGTKTKMQENMEVVNDILSDNSDDDLPF